MTCDLQSLRFSDKLRMIRDIYFEAPLPVCPETALAAAEDMLHISLPEPLKDFYRVFGNCPDFLTSQYQIAAPEALAIKNDLLIFAAENQGVCHYGIHLPTQSPTYIDFENNITEPIDQSLSDFLLFLLGLQGTGFAVCVGLIEPDAEFEPYLTRISDADGDGAVFCRVNAMVAVRTGEELYLCAKNDLSMDLFENETGIEVDFM